MVAGERDDSGRDQRPDSPRGARPAEQLDRWDRPRFHRLAGPIPAGLGQLRKMTVARFYRSPLVDGDLPDLSALTALTTLHVYGTKIRGPLPSWIGQLTLLRELSLSDEMSGALPQSLFTLSKLQFFFSRAEGVTGNQSLPDLQLRAAPLLRPAWPDPGAGVHPFRARDAVAPRTSGPTSDSQCCAPPPGGSRGRRSS